MKIIKLDYFIPMETIIRTFKSNYYIPEGYTKNNGETGVKYKATIDFINFYNSKLPTGNKRFKGHKQELRPDEIKELDKLGWRNTDVIKINYAKLKMNIYYVFYPIYECILYVGFY